MTNIADRPTAFYGLGAMGLPIACNLARAVRQLTVIDIAVDRVDAVRAAVPAVLTDPDAASLAEVVFLCLPTSEATCDVVESLLAGGPHARLFIDFGAQPPDVVTKLSACCHAAGSTYCDVPVFGSPRMAMRGELYFLCSGPKELADDFSDLADSIGYRTRYAGPAGTASTIKILQNALGIANLAAAAEALRVCESLGIESRTFIDVVRECSGIGHSSVFDRFAEDMAARRDSGEGRLRIAAKDSASVAALAAARHVTTPLLRQTSVIFEQAVKAGMADRQFTDIIDIEY